MAERLLLIGGDADLLRAAGDSFERLGYELAREATGEGGVEAHHRLRPSLVILDLSLPDVEGLEVLGRLQPDGAPVIVIAREGDTERTVRAMQLGAEACLTKPVQLQHLAAAAARALEKARLRRQGALLRARDHVAPELDALGVSPAMQQLARQIDHLVATDQSTLLLTGESGTGKGWVARIVHRLSARADGPFVEVNCDGLPATLLDVELFGSETGGSAKAGERREGLLELADHGSILLDEVGALAADLQPKLLEVLETKTFRPLGGTREIRVDTRLIATTNRDLASEVKAGRFREDLHDRLNAMPIRLPPLRERSREDRLAVLTGILADLGPEMPGCPRTCTADALDRLLSAPWPGNVRELRNAVERAMIVARGCAAIGLDHLPPDLRRSGGTGGAGGAGGDRRHQPQSLAEVERLHIEKILKHHGGNRTRAAQELGISRATLINKIKVYGLDL